MTKTGRRIAAFNWKLDPTDLDTFASTHKHLKRLSKKYSNTTVLFAPPTQTLGIKLGADADLIRAAQTISLFNNGAHTGNVSATLLRNMGVTYTIIGHSEIREETGMSDEIVSKKVSHALSEKLTPIVCFGESKRDTKGKYTDVLESQILIVLDPLTDAQRKKVILAYEPIWAIGKNAARPITSEELFSTIILIKNIIARAYGETISKKIKILYGGSVKAHNAEELAAVTGVSGFLVGSASHKSDQLEPIIESLS